MREDHCVDEAKVPGEWSGEDGGNRREDVGYACYVAEGGFLGMEFLVHVVDC